MSSLPGAMRPAGVIAEPAAPTTGGRALPPVSTRAIVAIALVLALLAGRLFADGHVAYGIAIVVGVCVGPIVFLDMTLALALYVMILFVGDAHSLGPGPNTVGVLVLLGWVGTLVTRSARPVVLRERSWLIAAIALFALWLTLSLVWSTDAGATGEGLEDWLLAMLAFLVAVTTLHSRRDVTIVCAAFILGAVISVLFGIASGALSATAEATGEATGQGGRFTGGGGDPNVQAAGYVVAMFLCAGCWALTRRPLARVTLVVAFVITTVGFFATQSRGGLIALGAAAIAGLLLLPRQRKRLLGLTAAAGIALGVVTLANPGAIDRMTNFGGGSSGRDDLWQVAWTIFKDHHWIGIGLNNFEAIEPSYSLNSGTLSRVELVAEHPHLVHNVYLQLLTETGVVGFALFLVVIGACMRAAWLAAKRFDALGRTGYGDLARAALMAAIAMLTAQVFISDGSDWRLWILLAIGPVLLSLARRASPREGPPPPPPGRRRSYLARARRQRRRSMRAQLR